jgi:hypothetical protein
MKTLFLLALAACGGASTPPPVLGSTAPQGTNVAETPAAMRSASVCQVDEAQCGRSMVAEGACGDWKSDMIARCHSLADPIVMDDREAFSHAFSRVVMYLGTADMVKELKGKDLDRALTDAGGVRGFLGLPHGAPVEVAIDRDCSKCARSFVAYRVTSAKTSLLLLVEGSKLEISQKKD